jgi:ferredoxin/flavodoxin---NADP+ reductase
MPLELATIVRRQDFTDDLFVLRLSPQHPLSFKAGQYITIGVGGIERPYSIVSAPYEPLIELFIERVAPDKGGTLTPILHGLRVGDIVTMRPKAKGMFTLDPTAHHHVMVATVTGIAPYVSMIRQAAHERSRAAGAVRDVHFYVLHGASFANEFVYERELQHLSEDDPLFIQYVASVSRPSDERNARWRGTIGRVNEILERHLARWSPLKADTVIYLCGHPGMIADAEERLVPQGWSIAQEQYWVPRAHQPAFAGA